METKDLTMGIDIPFGAKDSELKGWTYTIPEGMEAVIEEGKVIVREKKSEDERVRKELVKYFKRYTGGDPVSIKFPEWIAWLEKQGEKGVVLRDTFGYEEGRQRGREEGIMLVLDNPRKYGLEKHGEQNQKHFELKAGHWYICHRAFCCRADSLTVKEGERFMCEKDGVVKGFVIKEPEKYFKECSAPAPMEKEQEQNDEYEVFEDGNATVLRRKQKPADKLAPECDTCINDKGCVTCVDGDQWEGKPTWSKEDNSIIEYLIDLIDSTHKEPCTKGLLAYGAEAWLRTIKDRVQPQPKQEWSEEDYNEIETIACHLDNIDNEGMAEVLRNMIANLKKLMKHGKEIQGRRPHLLRDRLERRCLRGCCHQGSA